MKSEKPKPVEKIGVVKPYEKNNFFVCFEWSQKVGRDWYEKCNLVRTKYGDLRETTLNHIGLRPSQHYLVFRDFHVKSDQVTTYVVIV